MNRAITRALIRAASLLLPAALVCLSGCQWVVSKHPLSDEKTSQIDERLLGTWEFETSDNPQPETPDPTAPKKVAPRFVIGRQPGKETLHEMAAIGVDSDGRVQIHRGPAAVTQLGDERYVSFLVGEAAEPAEKRKYWIMRYELHGEHEVRLYSLDYNKVAAAIERAEIAGTVTKSPPDPSLPPPELLKPKYLEVALTASTDELRTYFRAHPKADFHTKGHLTLRRVEEK
jgi:hypothetical protein